MFGLGPVKIKGFAGKWLIWMPRGVEALHWDLKGLEDLGNFEGDQRDVDRGLRDLRTLRDLIETPRRH